MNIKKCSNVLKYTVRLLSFCVLAVVVLSTSVIAAPSVDVTDSSFTYWEGKPAKKAVKTKAVYSVDRVLDASDLSIASFCSLEQVFAYKEKLYVLDGVNGIIYVFDTNYKLEKTISSFQYNGEVLTFRDAKGIFVNDSGIYIADTANGRIICTDGEIITAIVERPVSSAVPATLKFAPTRMVRDENGFLYVLCDGSYYGLMVFSDSYEFLGFFGANQVQTSFVGAVKDFITSVFETEEKHSSSVQALPFQMIDVCIDPEGFICTVNSEKVGQIRRFGPAGKNILVHANNFYSENADNFNFGDYPNMYQDTSSKYGGYIQESFCAITADENGFYYAVDRTKGRIFVYDNKCNLLSAFGGGVGEGDKPGTFITPTSVAVFGDNLIVSDYATKSVTVFCLTEYGSDLKQAAIFTNKSLFLQAKPYWERVNAADKNCQIAYKGLAKAALAEKDYEKALEYAEIGWDRVTYSKAFKVVRDNFIKRNFWWIAICTVLLITGVVVLGVVTKKRKITFIKNKKLNVAANTILHPFDSFKAIKYYNLGSPLLATVFLALFYITKVTATLSGGFMYKTVDIDAFNSFFTLLGSGGIVILWAICNYGVCILFEGKGSVKGIYCATCYSLAPMIIYYIAYIILSHTVIPDTNEGFGLLSTVATAIMVVFILIAVTVIHEFSFFKSIGTAVVTVIGMLIVAFAMFLMFTLLQDLVAFVLGIVNEITLR